MILQCALLHSYCIIVAVGEHQTGLLIENSALAQL